MLKKLPFSGKMLYASSSAGWAMIDRIVLTWLMYYYITSPAGGEPLMMPVVFGTIMLLGRVVDAVADPMVALWSDNFKGRLGRRIPFMLVGGIFYFIVFVALFYPPVAGNSVVNVVYLALLVGMYFFLFTVYVCPYLALLPELARTSRDRVDLATLRAVFSLLGVAVALVGSGLLIAALGFKGMIWSLGFLGLLFMYLPALIKEKDYAQSLPATLGLIDAVMTTFKNRAFRIYLVGNATFWFGFNIITLGLPFYVTVLLGLQEEQTSIFFAVTFGMAVLTFPLVNILAKKMGPKIVMVISMFLFVLVLPFFYFLGGGYLGLSPYNFGLLIMGFAGIPLASLFVLPDAIVASITDVEQSLSGQRREAMYFGAQGFVLKIVMGLSSFITGLLMQFFGQTAASPLGIQLTGPVAAVFILLGSLAFMKYPEKEVLSYEKTIPPVGG
ncbi:MFS transporter [Candidatus Contubernalis alkaliaceticus]|uniref:MFS transporter n=1 Tax=Candidatus Contubernalis alkaliaceticus TaxID=338645 RepID=UPI001F4BE46F|nr:MFS transporter [Candidatus Contubernalis alkalaceticus]UNC93308.1 MFS transporter [Candidatus Contubernalis alkalaceticus]